MVDGAALVQLHALAEPGAAGRGNGHRDGDLVLGLRGLLRRLRLARTGGVGGLGLDGAEIVDVERLARGLELGQGDQGAESLLGGEVTVGDVVRIAEARVVFQREGHQTLHHGDAVFGEARVVGRIDPGGSQRDDDHGGRVGICAVSAVIHAAILQLRG